MQHGDQHRMHLGQHTGFSPAGQEPAQRRAADLIDAGAQATPRRDLTQEQAQGNARAHRRAAEVAKTVRVR